MDASIQSNAVYLSFTFFWSAWELNQWPLCCSHTRQTAGIGTNWHLNQINHLNTWLSLPKQMDYFLTEISDGLSSLFMNYIFPIKPFLLFIWLKYLSMLGSKWCLCSASERPLCRECEIWYHASLISLKRIIFLRYWRSLWKRLVKYSKKGLETEGKTPLIPAAIERWLERTLWSPRWERSIEMNSTVLNKCILLFKMN